jgi:D-threonine aldolase
MLPSNPAIHGQLSDVLLDSACAADLLTPALAIYPDIVDENIRATLRQMRGDADRWQPHVKTAKLLNTLWQLRAHGIKRFKCSTTLEMLTACETGAEEVLLSYPSTGARARRVREIAVSFPAATIAATVENAAQVAQWRDSTVALYIDINPGMNRTGVEQSRSAEIVEIASLILASGLCFVGLHYYDGHNPQRFDRALGLSWNHRI